MKYNIEFCDKCREETLHRVFRRFGKSDSTGRKRLKRTVTWCMTCQRRKIKK